MRYATPSHQPKNCDFRSIYFCHFVQTSRCRHRMGWPLSSTVKLPNISPRCYMMLQTMLRLPTSCITRGKKMKIFIQHTTDSWQISWHFQVFNTSGLPTQTTRRGKDSVNQWCKTFPSQDLQNKLMKLILPKSTQYLSYQIYTDIPLWLDFNQNGPKPLEINQSTPNRSLCNRKSR